MELVKKLRIDNELGLHARSAAKIVALAGQYKASLFLKKDEQEVEGIQYPFHPHSGLPKGHRVAGKSSGRRF